VALGSLAFFVLFALHIALPHIPGGGMHSPQGVLAWMMAGVMMLCAACSPALPVALRPGRFTGLCLAGVVVLSLPLLYAPVTWRYLAELRVAGLWGGLLLMVAVRALFATSRLRTLVLALLLAGCVLEALSGIVQVLWFQSPHLPDWMTWSPRRRAVGVFLQPNVMASFTGTGVVLTWCLLGRTARPGYLALLLASAAVLAFCLPLTQSTQAWLAAALAAGLATLTSAQTPPRRRLMALWLGVVVAGILGSIVWSLLNTGIPSHAAGRLGRLQMWQNALWLIAQRPWTGWGYGHFEMAYVHAWMTTGNVPQVDHDLTVHPHNELLYWLTEGGAVAGAGLLLILSAGISLLRGCLQARKSPDPQQQTTGTQALAILCCTLPVLMHSQLEWPFYLSAWHWLMVVMLLALADGVLQDGAQPGAAAGSPGPQPRRAPARLFSALARLLLVTGGLVTLWWMSTGLMVGLQVAVALQLQDFSPARIQAIEAARTHNPWVLKETVWRTEAVAQEQRAEQTGDLSLLTPVIGFEAQYLKRHPDADITASLLTHLRQTGQADRARALTARAQQMFPWDTRFTEVPSLPQTPFLNTGDVTAPDTTINPDTGIQDLTEETP
jgi:O-antigen polymerase